MLKKTVYRSLLAFAVMLYPYSIPLSAEEPRCSENHLIIETSLWMIANLFPDPADFYQLNVGYELDDRNIVFIGATTWKYEHPLGIPYGSDFESDEEKYPGYIRAFGVGIGYQRFLWKGLYASAYATPFLQTYHPSGGDSTSSGFQLYLQAHAGYQFNFFKRKLYIEPSVSFNYWPVVTGMPDSFERTESGWPSYFLFEPHLNIGIRL